MTELESKEALFKLHREYMMHKPKERLKLYNEYIRKRNEIKESLIQFIAQVKSSEIKVR